MIKDRHGEVARELESFIRDRFQVDDDDEFFACDVNLWDEGYLDSAGVVELIAHLEDSYAVQVPRSMLFDPEFTSVNGIAERVASLFGTRHTRGDEKPASGAFELRAGTGDKPLFFVGGIHIYQALAHEMGPSHRLFGVFLSIEADWIAARANGQRSKRPTLEETAASYVEVIKACQSSGPYRLAGLSNGGLVAYEVAQQLLLAGDEVEAVILLDTRLSSVMSRARGIRGRLGQKLRDFKTTRAGRRALRKPGHDVSMLRHLLLVDAIRLYERRIVPYEGPILLCRASDGPSHRNDVDPTLGWSHLVLGGLTTVACSGDHMGHIAGENAGTTAMAIDSYLDAIGANRE